MKQMSLGLFLIKLIALILEKKGIISWVERGALVREAEKRRTSVTDNDLDAFLAHIEATERTEE